MLQPAPLPISQLGPAMFEQLLGVVERVVVDLCVRETNLRDVGLVFLFLLGLLGPRALLVGVLAASARRCCAAGRRSPFVGRRSAAARRLLAVVARRCRAAGSRPFVLIFGDAALMLGLLLARRRLYCFCARTLKNAIVTITTTAATRSGDRLLGALAAGVAGRLARPGAELIRAMRALDPCWSGRAATRRGRSRPFRARIRRSRAAFPPGASGPDDSASHSVSDSWKP